MPNKLHLIALIVTIFIAAEAIKHYLGMSLFPMGLYHPLALALDVVIATGAIIYVWFAGDRYNETIRRKNEELTRVTEELRRTEEMKDKLTAMIVHDLRNPLTGVMGGLQLMEAASAVGNSDNLREYHRMAWTSSQRMLRLVNHLLDITKLESGKMTLQLSSFPVVLLIADAVEQNRLLAESQGARIETNIPQGLPLLEGDWHLLLRVLDNLIGNALKFTDNEAAVHVTARAEKRRGEVAKVVISVSDKGPGIPQEYHEKIFDKFGTVEAHQAGAKPSTGLGLTFCKLAVEAHGGAIRVESEEGAGTTFLVSLPVAVEGVTHYNDGREVNTCGNTLGVSL